MQREDTQGCVPVMWRLFQLCPQAMTLEGLDKKHTGWEIMQSVLVQVFVTIEPYQAQKQVGSAAVTLAEEGGVVAIDNKLLWDRWDSCVQEHRLEGNLKATWELS